jgi:hypothetical protein
MDKVQKPINSDFLQCWVSIVASIHDFFLEGFENIMNRIGDYEGVATTGVGLL